jgi:hypothetical protein
MSIDSIAVFFFTLLLCLPLIFLALKKGHSSESSIYVKRPDLLTAA